MRYRVAEHLRSIAEWLDRPHTFHWPRWVPWRRMVMMRWAVKEHRRRHNETGFIFGGDNQFLSLRRMARMMERINKQRQQQFAEAMGNAIKWDYIGLHREDD